VISAQDFIDITLAFNSAAALALGWLLAGTVTGISRESWFSLSAEDHQSSVLGISGVLRTWLLAWPLGQALKQLALGSAADAFDLTVAANDGTGMLIVCLVWRRLLLWRNGWL